MKTIRKIAFIGYGMYAGGAEANAIHIADHLQKKGVLCDFISIRNKADYKNQYENFFKKIREYYLIKNGGDSNFLIKIVLSLQGLITFFSILKREKYDLFFSVVEYHPSLLTIIAGLFYGKKTIVTIHDNLCEDLLRRPYLIRLMYRAILTISLTSASNIVCVSYGLKEQMMSYFNINKDKLIVIHNGIDIKKIKKIAGKKQHTNKFKLIILSRLVEKKDHILALNSVKQASKLLNITCEIIGKGPMKAYLQRLVCNLKIKSIVKFRGFIKEDPYVYLKNADIFLFTSKYEGFGNAIVEAMACGLPVISSNCKYGPLEILSKPPYDYATSKKTITYAEYGVLVDTTDNLSTDSMRFCKAISKLLDDKKRLRQYGKQSLIRAQYFSVEKMCSAYYKLILSLF